MFARELLLTRRIVHIGLFVDVVAVVGAEEDQAHIAYAVRLVPEDPEVAKYSSFVAVCVQKALVIESPVYIGRLTHA